MDRLQAMQVFSRVVETKNFNKAAEALGIMPSSATRMVKNLERFLGVRLLNRTTRQLSLTPDGQHYYEHCRRILADIDHVEATFPGGNGVPRGRLRIDVSSSLGRRFILPAVRDYQQKYPQVSLAIGLSDRTVDLVQEGIDCAIRTGILQDSASLVAKRIAGVEWVTCATPQYLRLHGTPRDLADLQYHESVGYMSSRTGRSMDWNYVVDGEEVSVNVPEKLTVNDTDGYVTCALESLGLIRVGSYMVLPHLRSGRLVQVLEQYRAPAVPVSVIYPQSIHLSPTVRSFVDWTAALFAASPLSLEPTGSTR
nr:LysR family transcriptional regulator [uncultured Pseudomonas sp.]